MLAQPKVESTYDYDISKSAAPASQKSLRNSRSHNKIAVQQSMELPKVPCKTQVTFQVSSPDRMTGYVNDMPEETI